MINNENSDFYKKTPSFLTESLYLSAAAAITSKVLADLKITSLVNATLEMPSLAYQKQECIQIAIEDRICSKLYVYFDLVADKINSVHLNGGKILVYCRAGMSRSASLCIAYFMKYRQMNMETALNYVKERRPIIHPNIGFLRQLREYETKIYKIQRPTEKSLFFAKEIDLPNFNSERELKTILSNVIIKEFANSVLEERVNFVAAVLWQIVGSSESHSEEHYHPTKAFSTLTEPAKISITYFTIPLIDGLCPTPLYEYLSAYVSSKASKSTYLQNYFAVSISSNTFFEFSNDLECKKYELRKARSIKIDPTFLSIPLVSRINLSEHHGFFARKTIGKLSNTSRTTPNRVTIKSKGLNLSTIPMLYRINFSVEENRTFLTTIDPPILIEKIEQISKVLVTPFEFASSNILLQENVICFKEPQLYENISEPFSNSKILQIFCKKVINLQASIEIFDSEPTGQWLEPVPIFDLSNKCQPFYYIITRKDLAKGGSTEATSMARETPKISVYSETSKSYQLTEVVVRKRKSNMINWAAQRRLRDINYEQTNNVKSINYSKAILLTPKLQSLTLILENYQTFFIPILVCLNLMPRFDVPKYPVSLVTNLCISPLNLPLPTFQIIPLCLTNIFCEPIPLLSKCNVSIFKETISAKLLKRRVGVRTYEPKVHNDLTELSSIPEGVRSATEMRNLLKNNTDINKVQVWIDFFKDSIIRSNPIKPFVVLVSFVSQISILEEVPLEKEMYLLPHSFSHEIADPIKENKHLFLVSISSNSICVEFLEYAYSLENFIKTETKVDVVNSAFEKYSYAPLITEVIPRCTTTIHGSFEKTTNERKPFSIITGLGRIVASQSFQSELEMPENLGKNDLNKAKASKNEEYNRYSKKLDNISEPVDSFWYFNLEKSPPREAKLSKNHGSNYHLFLPDPEVMERLENAKPENKVKCTLISYQKPRSRSRRSGDESVNRKTLRDLENSVKQSNYLLQKRRVERTSLAYKETSSPHSQVSSYSSSTLRGLLESAQSWFGNTGTQMERRSRSRIRKTWR